MGIKENFKTAVRELLPEEHSAPLENNFSVTRQPPEDMAVVAPVQRTEIAAGVTVQGTIQGAGSLDIHGQWIGNIDIEGDLRLYGSLGGDLTARSVVLKGGRMRGDIRVPERADIDSGSVVLGNIQAGELNLQGRIKGDVTVKGQLALGATAVLSGQITAGSLSVAAGAALQGKVRIASEDGDKLFHETEEQMKDIPMDYTPKESPHG